MARLVLLTFPARTAFAVYLLATATLSLRAQNMMEEPAVAHKQPVSAPSTNAAAGAPPIDSTNIYGKIVAPGKEVAHPLRLTMPFADVGEIKVPDNDELMMRDKLEELAKLSDADIRARLAEWPAFSKMSLRDEGIMLQRIQDFRDRHAKIAEAKQHELGLLTLTPVQQARFEKEYWDKRLAMDHDLARQFHPVVSQHLQQLQEDLFREFSVASPVPTMPAGRPAPPPPAAKTTAVTPAIKAVSQISPNTATGPMVGARVSPLTPPQAPVQ